MVQKARELCEDLLSNVKEQYEQFKSRPPRGYGDRQGNASAPSYQGYGGYNSPAPGAGAGASSASPPGASSAPGATDYAAQYSQYYQSGDPYAAYGGYAA